MLSAGVPGLIFTPELLSPQVRSLEMTFEPSLGIMARKVDKLGMDIRSFREPLKRAIQRVVIPSIQMNFHKHGRPKWQPLTTMTQEKKGHAIPLHLTGELRRVMKQIGIWHIDAEKALLANLPDKVWYGVVHQAGNDSFTRSGRKASASAGGAFVTHDEVDDKFVNVGEEGAIPARPFVMLQPEDNEDIDEIFLDWLDERAFRAGLPTSGRTMILSGGF